jgi:hypothetical protein
MKFPLPYVPTTTYKDGNGFGGNRDKVRKGLKHAANDLAAPPGTPVLAMDDGVVISKPYRFFPKEGPLITWALGVKHPSSSPGITRSTPSPRSSSAIRSWRDRSSLMSGTSPVGTCPT